MRWFINRFIKKKIAKTKDEFQIDHHIIIPKSGLAVSIITSILALTLGIVSSAPLLDYTGRQPINIFSFIFIFLLLPLCFNLFFICLTIFKYIRFEVSENLRIGSLAMVFFAIGGLMTLSVKVIFTDMVFGWSTTSGLTAAQVHLFTSFISFPWSFLSNDFVPSLQFVEYSQFIKMGESFKTVGGESISNLKSLGNWWKFLSMSVIVYGVLPRSFIFIFLNFFHRIKIKKNTKVDIKLSLIFDQNNLKTYFFLEKHELTILNSILYQITSLDIDNENDSNQKELKKVWLNDWKKDLQIISQEELITSLGLSASPKVFKVIADASLFIPYYSFNDKKYDIKNFKANYSREYLNQIVTLSGNNPESINEYYNEYQKLFNRDKYIKWGAIATLSLVGVVTLVITGGAAAPYIGGGGLLGTIGPVADKLYNNNDQAYHSDLCKLIALIRCEFFNHDHFQKNISLYRDYVLGHIKSQSFDKTKKNKALEKISKAFLEKEKE